MKHARIRRDAGDYLCAALVKLGGSGASVTCYHGKRWASATFTGVRHMLTLDLNGPGSDAAARRLAADLPEHEFTLRGHIVADMIVVQRSSEMDKATLEIEALTVEDA